MANRRPKSGPKLTADAINRGTRAFLVALLIAVGVDVLPVVNDALSGTDPIDVAALGKAALRVGLQAVVTFLMRRVIDPSPIPSLLPPDPSPRRKRKG